MQAVLPEKFAVRVERMAADVKAEQFLLGGEDVSAVPLGEVGHDVLHRLAALLERAEERRLAGLAVARLARRLGQGAVDHGELPRARTGEAVARAALDERLEHLAVHRAGVATVAQIEQVAERLAGLAGLDDCLHGNAADALDRRHAKTNDRAVPRRGEQHLAFVDIRRQHLDVQRPGLVGQHAQLGRVAHVVGHVGREKLDRKVRLQVGGLVGHHGVGRRVRLVETVTGELLQQVENLVGFALGNVVVLGAPLHELLALFLHHLDLLFAHRAAQ